MHTCCHCLSILEGWIAMPSIVIAAGANYWRQHTRALYESTKDTETYQQWLHAVTMAGTRMAGQPPPGGQQSCRAAMWRAFNAWQIEHPGAVTTGSLALNWHDGWIACFFFHA